MVLYLKENTLKLCTIFCISLKKDLENIFLTRKISICLSFIIKAIHVSTFERHSFARSIRSQNRKLEFYIHFLLHTYSHKCRLPEAGRPVCPQVIVLYQSHLIYALFDYKRRASPNSTSSDS